MPDQRMPGASYVARRSNRNMLGGPPRATHHITWDVLRQDGTRAITLDGVTNYLLNVGYEPHVTIDPFTGEARQLLDAEASGFALENNGIQTNRRGLVNLQVEWFFTPGTVYNGHRYNALTDTPMRGLPEFLAWCDSWGIPRLAPLAPNDRNEAVWAGTAGHYGHFNAPRNSHSDPIVSIGAILAKAGTTIPTPAPQPPAPGKEEDQMKFLQGVTSGPAKGQVWLWDSAGRIYTYVGDPDALAMYRAAGVPYVGDFGEGVHNYLSSLARNAGFTG